jgi:hypothetical protein
MYWRKVILFTFTVLTPAVIVGISNFAVFPDSSLPATLMLIATVGVAGVFTYFSGDATARVRRYCIVADVVICAILCVNLGGHWILAREVSAARAGVEERHVEEEREDRRREAEAERQLRLKQAEAEVIAKQTAAIHAERRRLAQLPPEERRSVLKAAPKPEPTKTTIQPLSLAPMDGAAIASASSTVKRPTPDEVRDKWWWFLTALAIAECAASVLAGAILAGVWEWDRNRDVATGHIQNGAGVARPRETTVARNFDEPLFGQGSKAPFDTPSPKAFPKIQSASDRNEGLNQFSENIKTRDSASVDGETCPICGGALEEQSGKHYKRVWCPTPGHLDAWRDARK